MEQQPPAQNRSTRSARLFNHVHRFKNVLRRLWWVLLLALVISIGIKAFLVLRQPKYYISVGQMTVSIKIQIPTGSVYSEEVSQFLGTQIAFMRSPEVKDHAAERVRALKPDLVASGVALQIGVLPKTTIFNLQATGTDPEYTRAYLDACMEEYINFKRKLRTATSENTLASITEQLVSLERELKKYESQLLAFQESNSVVFLQEQGNSAGTHLAKLNLQLADFKSDYQLLNMLDLDQNLERQQANPQNDGPQKNLDSLSVSMLQSGYLKGKQDVQLMKAELKEWSQFLKPKHPRVIQLNEEISRQERLLGIYKQQSLEQLESRRSSLVLQIQNTERDIKEWEVKSLDASRRMAEYERIRASKQRVQSLYDRLLGATQSLGVDTNISQESVAIMQRATAAVPADLEIIKALIVAAIVGLMAGLLILIVVDRFDDRPASFIELQDMFDEPVLGQIPLEARGKSPGVPLLQPGDTRHAFSEAYRNLRSSLLYMATEGKRPKLLLVTSAIPGDGKSMTAANLAITLAQSGSKVILVDADIRRGELHRHFQINPAPGLNEVLSAGLPWKQTAQATPVQNLTLLPRGEFARNPGEMFLSQRMLDLLKELRESFDYIVIDTAPVMAADDVTSLAPHVEGVVFVIRAACTSARVARAALDLLYQRDVEVLGLVFNGVEINTSDYYYYKYKSYYAENPKA